MQPSRAPATGAPDAYPALLAAHRAAAAIAGLLLHARVSEAQNNHFVSASVGVGDAGGRMRPDPDGAFGPVGVRVSLGYGGGGAPYARNAASLEVGNCTVTVVDQVGGETPGITTSAGGLALAACAALGALARRR